MTILPAHKTFLWAYVMMGWLCWACPVLDLMESPMPKFSLFGFGLSQPEVKSNNKSEVSSSRFSTPAPGKRNKLLLLVIGTRLGSLFRAISCHIESAISVYTKRDWIVERTSWPLTSQVISRRLNLRIQHSRLGIASSQSILFFSSMRTKCLIKCLGEFCSFWATFILCHLLKKKCSFWILVSVLYVMFIGIVCWSIAVEKFWSLFEYRLLEVPVKSWYFT